MENKMCEWNDDEMSREFPKECSHLPKVHNYSDSSEEIKLQIKRLKHVFLGWVLGTSVHEFP